MANEEEINLELLQVLQQLNNEADKAIKSIENIKKKGYNAVRKVESVFASNMKHACHEHTKQILLQSIERLIEINVDLELAEDETPKLEIPYISTGNNLLKLKFLTGDNPWNFWLCDNNVDTKAIHKMLLKKYQNDLLDVNPNAKPSDSVCFFDRNKIFRGIVLHTFLDNRVKLIDCDSNIVRVVSKDRVFKADPDACHVNASVFNCTITNDSDNAKQWDKGLCDIFCNILKEAVLHVKVLERIPGTLPSFLVDVELENEDCNGNLKEWIIGRLLPELSKLKPDENESVLDFLSSEALDPYYKSDFGATQGMIDETKLENNLSNIASIRDPKDNNLNSSSPKTSDKIVRNVDTSDDEKTLKCEENKVSTSSVLSEVQSSSPDNDSVSTKTDQVSSSCEESNTIINSKQNKNEAVLDVRLNCSSQEFQPTKQVPPVVNQMHLNLSYENHTGLSQPYSYTQPVRYPNNMQFPPNICPSIVPPWTYVGIPLQTVYNKQQHPYPPPVLSQWQTENNEHNTSNLPHVINKPKERQQSNEDGTQSNSVSKKIQEEITDSDCNHIKSKVNVMAPEFVPLKISEENINKKEVIKEINHTKNTNVPVHNSHSEIAHVVLRKPSTLLTPGENLLVMIAYVESPSEFYVHFASNNNKYLDKLRNDMLSHYTSIDKVEFHSWQAAKSTLGKFCACKWLEDNHWYRAEVLDWNLNDGKVKVYFVDYGNTDSVSLSCLQPLVQQFAKLSMSAQPCHLAKVYPLIKHESWSKESLMFFKSKLDGEENSRKVYSITVVPSQKKTVKMNSLSVLLYEGKGDDNIQSINDQLVERGLAWTKPIIKRSLSAESDTYLSLDNSSQFSDTISNNADNIQDTLQVNGQMDSDLEEELKTWDPLAEDFFSSRNNPAIDTDDACVAVTGYSPKDESRICKFYARGYCWKTFCNKEHSKPMANGVTTDKEEVYLRAFSEISLPMVGEEIKVRVTAVLSICIFYIQLSETRGIDKDEDCPETLTMLTNFINRSDNVNMMKHLKVGPALGQLVLAKYEDEWHRARVISSDINPEVMFIDYGTTSIIPITDLREMEPRYLHLPFQAIECSLANIVPPSPSSDEYDKGSLLLQDAIIATTLTAKVYDSVDTADMRRLEVLLELEDGIDVGEWLVGNNVCSYKPAFMLQT